MGDPAGLPERCLVCGHDTLERVAVLPPELVRQWNLAPDEAAYIDLQQGLHCARCRSTLRCMALASAIGRLLGVAGLFRELVASRSVADLSVLEVNEAGGLSPFLRTMPRHLQVTYPAVDMRALPFPDSGFDLVVHSDTLEHVPEPVRGLSECRRVLRPGGACVFTVPVVVGRLTRDRQGLPDSFHGTPADGEGYRVHSEFGADTWRCVLAAGFGECRVTALAAPAAHAFTAIR